MALSLSSRYLYVLEAGAHAVGVFELQRSARWAPVPLTGAGGLPAPAVGLVAIGLDAPRWEPHLAWRQRAAPG